MAGLSYPPGPGKTAPRLYQDLVEYDPRRPRKNGANLLVDPAAQWRPDRPYPKRTLPGDCRHNFLRKNSQSMVPGTTERVNDERWISASFCSKCLHHFDVIADYTSQPNRTSPCAPNTEYPLHHFVYNPQPDANYATNGMPSKYRTPLQYHQFQCSAPNCSALVEIRIFAPRLPRELLNGILDQELLKTRGEKAIEAEPERFRGQRVLHPFEALAVLRAYLRDTQAKAPEEVKRIAVRNKKFLLAFSDECDDLFQYLGFKRFVDQGPDDEEEQTYWALPTLPPTIDDAFVRSPRTFLQDVLEEVVQLMSEATQNDPPPQSHGFDSRPLPASKDLQKCLGCASYDKNSRNSDSSGTFEDHPHYAGLGAISDMSDSLLGFAYDRQAECDPSNAPYYLDCLKGIATGRQGSEGGRDSEDLQEKVAMIVSMGQRGLSEIEDAYRYLGIDPYTMESDDHIIGTYNSRIESAPRQKDEARNCLTIIGDARSSQKIQAVARDASMTAAEALEFLCVTAETPSDTIEAYAVSAAIDGDKSRVARALRLIAGDRGNDYILQRAATKMESGNLDPDLSIDDAYKRLQISDHNAPDDTVFAYYHSLCGQSAAGSQDSYAEALRVIAESRNSSFLLTKLNDPDAPAVPEKSTSDQPVGLDNIGNTCYLNSLLQYYYTVNAVRDVVLDFSDYKMSLDMESLRKKRVGGRAVDKTEIVKSQKFVEELGDLFKSLKTSSTKSVKPTQDLAELTLLSTAAEANFRRASVSSPSGPPNLASLSLPVFGPEGPPATIPEDDDIEMVDRPSDKVMDIDDDDKSDSTLVDLESRPQEAHDDSSIAPEDKSKVTDVKPEEKHDNGSQLAADLRVASPTRKPPPVPPRSKPSEIDTSGTSEEALRAQKLQFGAQQDVTEVIGNVMFRLHCAIKPTSIDAKFGEQIDQIRETFYGSNAVYLKKNTVYEAKVEDWPNIIVYPGPKGSRDIYEALDVVYDEQMVEIDNTTRPQFASIKKLPPILQIQIQRTEYDPVKQQASKNQNRLVFDETIYLDRYMDAPENSTLMQRRKESWKWKERLRRLEARQLALRETKEGLAVPEALAATKDYLKRIQEAEIDGLTIDDRLPEALEDRAAQITRELERLDGETATLKKKLQDQFTDMRDQRYSLQAVFVHRGTSSYGHYWIYIYDFARDIWREYNDERVSEVTDRKKIFDQSNSGATPYYLVYVREQDKDRLVDAVCREIVEVPREVPDISMKVETEHVEHAPRDLEPAAIKMEETTVVG